MKNISLISTLCALCVYSPVLYASAAIVPPEFPTEGTNRVGEWERADRKDGTVQFYFTVKREDGSYTTSNEHVELDATEQEDIKYYDLLVSLFGGRFPNMPLELLPEVLNDVFMRVRTPDFIQELARNITLRDINALLIEKKIPIDQREVEIVIPEKLYTQFRGPDVAARVSPNQSQGALAAQPRKKD